MKKVPKEDLQAGVETNLRMSQHQLEEVKQAPSMEVL